MMCGARFGHRVPGVGDDVQLGARPGRVQFPRARDRADHVVTALHDDAGDVLELHRVFEQLVRPQEAVVDEVVAFDPREGFGEIVATIAVGWAYKIAV